MLVYRHLESETLGVPTSGQGVKSRQRPAKLVATAMPYVHFLFPNMMV